MLNSRKSVLTRLPRKNRHRILHSISLVLLYLEVEFHLLF